MWTTPAVTLCDPFLALGKGVDAPNDVLLDLVKLEAQTGIILYGVQSQGHREGQPNHLVPPPCEIH